ncbi:A/G-specific adenine glycosylase [Agitococcus lubricus]|uniref:Adenine DNA glycosylase n=1 Tax=Agitococcus lubricus TaxID=1077255 RepID=A0A2T5IUJ9_9GAMM|nr:A/G-specific adenine glycosylase [Agitococcus lubricus]PTQ87548.1 A/G-specific DNA-adenine glycosylase [Agitococcus lubricus]
MSDAFTNAVLAWFYEHGRHDLPWQQNPTPYRVWVSEIMLQQTQVATVIPYYQRFMTTFPTVEALAAAPEEVVLQHWAGLGYYARARNLHDAAQQVMALGGEFPDNLADLMALKGIGRSTAGAILSLAWQKRGVIMDGNVKRVLSRHFAIAGDSSSAAIQAILWQLADSHTPNQQNRAYTQAMMDLGATLCTRSKPLCLYCPVQHTCQAYRLGTPTAFPQKKPSKSIPTKEAYFLLLENEKGQLLWVKRPPTGIWGGLWCLPELPVAIDLAQELKTRYGLIDAHIEARASFKHTFSHYHLWLKPLYVRGTMLMVNDELSQWCDKEQALTLGLPKPMLTLLAALDDT